MADDQTRDPIEAGDAIELKRLRAELTRCREERAELEARLGALSTALADTAHTLKSPLTVILSYSELLMEDCDELGLETRQDLETIAAATRELARMITEKLTPVDPDA